MKWASNISNYYLLISSSFIKGLKKSKNLNHDAIHDMRVSVKHLRALLKLGASINKNLESETNLRLIKPLFRVAGTHRTLELIIKHVKKQPFKEVYITSLHKELKIAIKELKQQIKCFDLKKFKHLQNKIARNYSTFNEEKVTVKALTLSDKLLHSCKKIIKTKFVSDEELHEVRKDLKIVKANLQLLLYINKNNKVFKNQLKKITDAEEIVGAWHDNAVLYETLNRLKKSNALRKLKKENDLQKTEVLKRLNIVLN